MAVGEEAIITALAHMSSEIKGLRQEVRKVIELEAEARNHKEAIGRAFAEIKAASANINAVDVRVQHLEAQAPTANLVRVAVFAMIALVMMAAIGALFSLVIRTPPAIAFEQSSPAIDPPPRRESESYPRSQP